jgi:hypothetical protein
MALSPLLQAICDVVRAEFATVPAVIRLEELAATSTCPPVVIKKRGPALVLKLDAHTDGHLFPLFKNDTAGLTQVCDYIVFYQPDDARSPTVFVLLCELKSSRGDGALGQIENGKLLAEHIIAMAAHHRLVHEPPHLCYRGIIFQGRGVREQRGAEMRTACQYRQHQRMQGLAFAFLPALPERDISYFCA